MSAQHSFSALVPPIVMVGGWGLVDVLGPSSTGSICDSLSLIRELIFFFHPVCIASCVLRFIRINGPFMEEELAVGSFARYGKKLAEAVLLVVQQIHVALLVGQLRDDDLDTLGNWAPGFMFGLVELVRLGRFFCQGCRRDHHLG